MATDAALQADWLRFCRRAGSAARELLERHPGGAERRRYVGRGEGGDMTLAIDRDVEDAVFAELELLGVPVTAVAEERGHVAVAGGGPVHVVIDPIDGSLNAKREIPEYCLSIAVASGDSMADVTHGYVLNLASGEEFAATLGGGARLDGEALAPAPREVPLEVLAVESADPVLVGAHAEAIAASGAHRVRMLGSIALSLCYVAAQRCDAMFSLRDCRSVDAAAGQLIVREAGGAVVFPDGGSDLGSVPLALDMRSRIAAGSTRQVLDHVLAHASAGGRPQA